MPKGKNQKEIFTGYVVMCLVKDTHKDFQTKKEMNTYLKRHDKCCDCRLQQASGVLKLNVSTDDELTLNDLF